MTVTVCVSVCVYARVGALKEKQLGYHTKFGRHYSMTGWACFNPRVKMSKAKVTGISNALPVWGCRSTQLLQCFGFSIFLATSHIVKDTGSPMSINSVG